MSERKAKVIQMPKRRTENALSRFLGTAFVAFVVAAVGITTVLACVAVIAGLWRFIGWALA